MPLLYSLISRGPTILCSHQVGKGNYEKVVKKIVSNISTTSDARTTYTSDNYLFHVDVDNGLIYMCLSGPDEGKSVPYGFLTQIKQDFASAGLVDRARVAVGMELQGLFRPTLQAQMEKFSSGQGASGNMQFTNLQAQVDEVRDVMTQNIEKVLERGENLDDLMDKTDNLEYQAGTFQKTARKVHRKMWWKNTKMILIMVCIAVAVLVVIILIILSATGSLGGGGGGGAAATTPAAISNETSNAT